jgi:tRNA pseudouridine38-40 synthase
MPRFRLQIEYVGTRYRGWQVQANARTVQGELIGALRELSGRNDLELQGAGRTDAGVHALQQVAHLELQTQLSPERLRQALNDALPSDINVLALESAPHRFHARHDAVARSYLYQVARRRTAFAKPYVWWVKDELEIGRMQTAAAHFVGMKDFGSFSAEEREGASTKVLVDEVRIAEVGDLILLRVAGSHFIWKMVRRMVGVLVEVGRGSLGPGDVERFLRERSGDPAKATAPPSGLFLERVFYDGDERDLPLRPAVALPAAPAASREQPRRLTTSSRSRASGRT